MATTLRDFATKAVMIVPMFEEVLVQRLHRRAIARKELRGGEIISQRHEQRRDQIAKAKATSRKSLHAERAHDPASRGASVSDQPPCSINAFVARATL